MDGSRERLGMASPATYRICVQGAIQRSWSELFTGMRVTFRYLSTPDAVTFLTGDVLDQADLMGLLNRLYGLGLPLVSVQWRRGKVEQRTRAQARSRKSGKANPARTRRKASPKAGVAEG
jgi:hypothetical protein